MPRLPVDGNKVIEHRITLGTYERQQLERFIDGMQIRNIGQGFGAATDPLEAMFNTTLGTIGGAAIVAWAMKRFFGIDIPLDDKDDLLEMWAAIVGAIGISPEQREEIDKRINAIKTEDLPVAAVSIVSLTRRLELAIADILFGKPDSINYKPELYQDEIDPYADVDLGGVASDPDFVGPPTQAQYRENVAAAWYRGDFPFTYARDLLVNNGGMTAAGAATYLNNYEAEKSGSL